MAALAPLALNLGASAGLSGLGSLLGRSRPSAMENQVLNRDLSAQQTGLNTGQNLLGMGQQGVQPALNYWTSILSGNKGLATSALAPEIQQIGQGYNQAAQTSSALMPRGGPRADILGNMPFQQQRDVSTLFQQARPMAAQQAGSLGQGLIGQGANALYASTAAGRDVLQQQQALRQQEQQRGASIGQGMFSMFQQFGMPALAKKFPTLFGGMGGGSGGNSTATTGGNASIFS